MIGRMAHKIRHDSVATVALVGTRLDLAPRASAFLIFSLPCCAYAIQHNASSPIAPVPSRSQFDRAPTCAYALQKLMGDAAHAEIHSRAGCVRVHVLATTHLSYTLP